MTSRHEVEEFSCLCDVYDFVVENGLYNFFQHYDIFPLDELDEKVKEDMDITSYSSWEETLDDLSRVTALGAADTYVYNGAFDYTPDCDISIEDVVEDLIVFLEHEEFLEDDSENEDSLKERAMNEYLTAKDSGSVANLDGLFC